MATVLGTAGPAMLSKGVRSGTEAADSREPSLEALSWAQHQIDRLKQSVDSQGVVPQFGERAGKIVKQAVKRAKAVGDDAALLEQALDVQLQALYRRQLQKLRSRATDHYDAFMVARPNPLEALWAAEGMFVEAAAELVRPGSTWNCDLELRDLKAWLADSHRRDMQLVEEQGKQGRGKQITIEVIKKLQEQSSIVQRTVETRGAFPWDITWQYFMDKSPLGFRGRYQQGRSVVELLLMPSPDPRLKKNFLNRLGPINLAVAFDLFM